jgi:hypothetical protein
MDTPELLRTVSVVAISAPFLGSAVTGIWRASLLVMFRKAILIPLSGGALTIFVLISTANSIASKARLLLDGTRVYFIGLPESQSGDPE